MALDRNHFNSILVEEQIDYFNKGLFEGKTISKICNEIDISYNTIRDRFKRHNFTYNKFTKQYEYSNINGINNESLIEIAIEKAVKKIFSSSNNKGSLVCNLNGDTTIRSFRIYTETLNDFTKFCSESNYSQYDILSKFIQEGIEKYKII